MHYNKKYTLKRFKVKDKVLLQVKNIKQLRLSEKLANRYLRLFEITKAIGSHG